MLLTLDNMESYLSLFGMNDRNMAALEQELDVAISLRGQELQVQGDGENAALAEQVIGKLIQMLRRGEMIDASRIRYAVALAREGRLEQIEEIFALCEVKPTVLQTELHPYNQEPELKKFLSDNGIVPQAWYPLGHGDKALLQEPLFAQLGEKYGKSAPQIILRWHIQSGNIVIPGSKNPEHIKANFDLFDFALTDDEMAQVAALNKNVRYYTSTPEMLKKYAEMVPPVDEQK